MKSLQLLGMLVWIGWTVNAQTNSTYYNTVAGQNRIEKSMKTDANGAPLLNQQGEIQYEIAESDAYGNAKGGQYDLARDWAFSGKTIAVLQFYAESSFDFAAPKKALAEKGFSVYRWLHNPPPVEELRSKLDSACQLWIISDSYSKLTPEHIEVIKQFWQQGKGIYIWGDNDPYYADANVLAQALIGCSMSGNLMGAQVVTLDEDSGKVGVVPGHLVTTGIVNVYEGITIATLTENQALQPLIYGSAGNLVSAAYENNGQRLILDGGFTRLYYAWDSAGTDRYIKNAAAWLANVENN